MTSPRTDRQSTSTYRRWRRIVELGLALFLTVGVCLARAETRLRIGLFGLYHPQSLRIQLVSEAPTLMEIDGRAKSLSPLPGWTLEIRRSGDHLRFELMGANRQLGLFSSASHISLRSAKVGFAPIWRVVVDDHRLVRTLRGSVAFRIVNGAIQTVLETDRENLVARVIASEMSGIAELEALKALAIVARTFILANRARHRNRGFDFCDTTHCLWYQGEDRLIRQDHFSHLVRQAVRETEGTILTFHGRVRPVYFTSSCGGITASPDMVWPQGGTSEETGQQSVVCHWCRTAKFYRWQRRVRKATFLAALSDPVALPPSNRAEVVPEANDEGFVLAMWIIHDGRRVRFSEDEFRSLVGHRLGWNLILSNAYTIEDQGRWLTIRGRGFGHNVGLCLSGAVAQARAGRGYEDLLSYYFPAARIAKAPRSRPGDRLGTVGDVNGTGPGQRRGN